MVVTIAKPSERTTSPVRKFDRPFLFMQSLLRPGLPVFRSNQPISGDTKSSSLNSSGRPPVSRGRARISTLAMPVLLLVISGQASQARALPAPSLNCEEAIGEAARATGVPSRLIGAIGLVEAGRPDPMSQKWRPWPWTINAEGNGAFFNSKSEAIAAVRGLQAAGIRSIAVGCMQVNLMQHPDAFATLEEAFDPKRNANYAGRFLDKLFGRSGDWMIAAGWYHSTTSDLAADYVKRVMAVLAGGKQSQAFAGAASGSFFANGASPIRDRNGVLLPSVGLTLSGLIVAHPVEHYAVMRRESRSQFEGQSISAATMRPATVAVRLIAATSSASGQRSSGKWKRSLQAISVR
jgi:soluble lytic murein transglycosylase-like protein